MQKMTPAILTGTVFGLLQSFGLVSGVVTQAGWSFNCQSLFNMFKLTCVVTLPRNTIQMSIKLNILQGDLKMQKVSVDQQFMKSS